MVSCGPLPCGPQWLLHVAAVTSLMWLGCLLVVASNSADAAAVAVSPPSVSSCWTTFTAIDKATHLLEYRSFAHYCPPRCLHHAPPSSNTNSSGVVYGSYPYSPSSSVCLSAIHCGLLNVTVGGSVFVSRFYRHDWSGGETQTIYPFSSSQGSTSNNVSSVDVPPTSFDVPSNGSVYSFVVRGRGEIAVQRRSAPFPPRSGHVHAAFSPKYGAALPPPWPLFNSWSLIIGGHNGSHYLNDVWLAEPSMWNTTGSDISWRQLADAPFTPRSDMQWKIVDRSGYVYPHRLLDLVIVGGQTDHMCGLTELGVCSDEVWTLSINVSVSDWTPTSYRLQSVQWASAQPVARLPFSARCGASLLWFIRTATIALVAGQLSYNDTACLSSPVTTNEVWISHDDGQLLLTDWQQAANAPFSPRRSQQREDVLLIMTPLAAPWFNAGRELFPLAGGLRVLQLSGDRNVTQLAAVQVYADVWVCGRGRDRAPRFQCGWRNSDGSAVPTTSIPIPLAFGVSASVRAAWTPSGQRFGGFTASAAVSAWLSATPLGTDSSYAGPFNWTYIVRAVPYDDLSGTTAELDKQRLSQPMNYTLTAELSDPTSSYYMGTDFVSSHSPWITPPLSRLVNDDVLLPSLSTVHPQRYCSAVDPAHSTVFTPLPLSSRLTQRPHFQFELSRLGAGYDEWSQVVTNELFTSQLAVGLKVVSGGRSGNRSFSDWIAMMEVRCLPPDDPSFLPLLGALRWWYTTQPSPDPLRDASFGQRDRLSVACLPQSHFEPRLERVDEALFVCGPSGIWLDTDLQTIRACIQNEPLNCTAPLVDTGGLYCQPGRPFITRLSISAAAQVDNLTLIDLPVSQPDSVLHIEGANFTQPLFVTVGGQKCISPLLTGPQWWLCYNYTGAQTSNRASVCDWFADSLSCNMPAVLGLNLPVLVTSGPSAIQAEIDVLGATGTRVARVSSAAPSITLLVAYTDITENQVINACNYTEPHQLHLWNCPVVHPYNLSVCVDYSSVSVLSLIVTLGSSQTGLPCEEQNPLELQRANTYARCVRCYVTPFLGIQAVRVQTDALPLQSRTDASLSSGQCPVGYSTDYSAALNGLSTAVCVECPAGTSTRGVKGSSDCLACNVGHFAPSPGTSDCQPCPAGQYNDSAGADKCGLCPVNQYQPRAGQASCMGCNADQFLVYVNESIRDAGHCAQCPSGAVCYDDSITAAAGRFLVIDQSAAAVESLQCSTTACMSSSLDQCVASDDQILSRSALPVRNCCASGRRSGFTESWQTEPELVDTKGVNVLCALCQPGHTQMNGVCTPCSSTRWGRVTSIALLCLLMVYAVHRFPHDWSGAATMTILAYFLQQSDLFLSFSLLRTFNMDPLGAGSSSIELGDVSGTGQAADWCVVPMHTDGERLIGSLVSPPAVFLMLAVVGLLQWLTRQALPRSTLPLDSADAAQSSERRWLFSVYSILFLAPLTPPRSAAVFNSFDTSMAALTTPLKSAADCGEERDDMHDATQQLRHTDDAAANDATVEAPQSMLAQWGSMAAAAAQPSWLLYQRSFIRLLQLSYTALAVLAFRFFHWRPVGLYGWRLVDYPGLSPTSTTYHLLAPIMIACLTLVVLAPVLLFVFLFRQHRSGVIAELKSMPPSAACVAAAGSWRTALVLQLCCMFRSQCWWMAPLIPMRRLLVAAVLVAADSPHVWVWLTLTNNTLLALHLQLQPYEREQDNRLETFTLFVLCVETTLLCMWAPSDLPALFIMLVTGPVLVVAALKAAHIVRRCREVSRQRAVARENASSD